ncbi:MAG TPA: hypothetical protein VFG47_10015, partial [Geminicoccaceae bacterium]|nr:hypothetical protein [Geminicoccaceae bacterium]
MRRTAWTLVGAAAAMSVGLAAAQAPQPTPEDLEKHGTTPGDRYEPSLDVLKEQPLQPPGAREGVPPVTEQEFAQANLI